MRSLSTDQKRLLRSDHRVRLLCIFYLDEGTYAFCDDVVDATDGVYTYTGANALVSSIEVSSGDDLVAEPITMICDGNRMAQFGIQDPARVLSDMMDYMAHQRRVDWFLGFSAVDSHEIQLRIPIHAGKINNYRLVDDSVSMESGDETQPSLQIVIDALASRYSRTTNRTRSHEDQQEISPGDMFYSFTMDAAKSEGTLYWGKNAPYASSNGGYPDMTNYGAIGGPYYVGG